MVSKVRIVISLEFLLKGGGILNLLKCCVFIWTPTWSKYLINRVLFSVKFHISFNKL